MNQKKAKRIRKIVYGDGSKRDVTYAVVGKKNNQIICTGLRAVYKKLKKGKGGSHGRGKGI
jgi:hypothetical protein